jgi:hypothetical protein
MWVCPLFVLWARRDACGGDLPAGKPREAASWRTLCEGL